MSDLRISSISSYIQESYHIQIPDEKKPLEFKKFRISVTAQSRKDPVTNLLTLSINHVACGNFKLCTRSQMVGLVFEDMQTRYSNFTVVLTPMLEAVKLGITYTEYMNRFQKPTRTENVIVPMSEPVQVEAPPGIIIPWVQTQ